MARNNNLGQLCSDVFLVVFDKFPLPLTALRVLESGIRSLAIHLGTTGNFPHSREDRQTHNNFPGLFKVVNIASITLYNLQLFKVLRYRLY